MQIQHQRPIDAHTPLFLDSFTKQLVTCSLGSPVETDGNRKGFLFPSFVWICTLEGSSVTLYACILSLPRQEIWSVTPIKSHPLPFAPQLPHTTGSHSKQLPLGATGLPPTVLPTDLRERLPPCWVITAYTSLPTGLGAPRTEGCLVNL